MSMVEMNGFRPPLTSPFVYAVEQSRGDSKKCCHPVHKKDTTTQASSSCANLDNRGCCLYNNVVESLSTQN